MQFHPSKRLAVFSLLILIPYASVLCEEKPNEINRAITVPADGNQGTPSQPVQDARRPTQFHVQNISAKPPVPALKYRLFPSRGEMKPGDSTPFYYRTLLELQSRSQEARSEFEDIQGEFGELPLEEFIKPENIDRVRKAASYLPESQIQENLLEAAYRDNVNWDFQMNRLDGPRFIAFLLPEAQEMRQLGRVMQMRARLQAAEGDIESALQSCLLTIKAGHDVAEQPTLISDLVGIAMSTVALYDVSTIICQTDCPNLYWTLAALPDPLISIREALEHEAMLPEIMFPFLRDPETEKRTSEEWARLVREMLYTMRQVDSGLPDGAKERALNDVLGAAVMLRSYPTAKRELVAAGWDKTEVQNMSVGQVIAIYQKRLTRISYDEMLKWAQLPFAEAAPFMKALNDEQRRIWKESREPVPIAPLLLPGVTAVKQAEARLQSKIKGLMVLEAIRMHAAENGGHLPRSLDEITIVPLPECPMTGKPYEYQFRDGTATLYIVADPRPEARYIGWEFHLQSH